MHNSILELLCLFFEGSANGQNELEGSPENVFLNFSLSVLGLQNWIWDNRNC